jgi:hypothetical protein
MNNNFFSNSKSHLISNKSLKENHFEKFLNNIIANPYYNYIANNKIQKKDIRISTNIKEISKENTNEFYDKIRKYKTPKNINRNFKCRPSQYKYIKKDKDDYNNFIFNYKSYIKRNNYNNSLQINENANYNESIFDPKKISNNYINFNTDKECSKITPAIEKTKIKLNINDYKEKKKKDKFNYKNNNIRIGFFAQKDNMGIPYLFDTFTMFSNKYSNKSEKTRHEVILNDLFKLKGFLKGNPNNKITLFKNFLCKYKISDIELSEDKILEICNILSTYDNELFIHFLKPHLNLKDMALDLINNLSSLKDIIANNNADNIDNTNNNINNNAISTNNNTNTNTNNNTDNNNNIKNNIKTTNSSTDFLNNINDDLLFKTKINNKIEAKDNRNARNTLNGKISNKTNDFFSKTQNSFINKKNIIFYQSPYFIPPKSHHIIISTNNKPKNFSSKRKLDLSETNSLLKNLKYQTKALGPSKEYSINNDLLINDISKEMKILEHNYNKVLITNRTPNFKSKTQNKLKFLSKKGLYHSSTAMNYLKKGCDNYDSLNSKDFFSKTSVHFFNKNNRIKINNGKINLKIISLKLEKIDKLKKSNSNTEPCFKKGKRKKVKSLNEINVRMYYKPIKYKFGYKQIKDQNKITECAALNFAKKKKYDPMGLICNL